MEFFVHVVSVMVLHEETSYGKELCQMVKLLSFKNIPEKLYLIFEILFAKEFISTLDSQVYSQWVILITTQFS